MEKRHSNSGKESLVPSYKMEKHTQSKRTIVFHSNMTNPNLNNSKNSLKVGFVSIGNGKKKYANYKNLKITKLTAHKRSTSVELAKISEMNENKSTSHNKTSLNRSVISIEKNSLFKDCEPVVQIPITEMYPIDDKNQTPNLTQNTFEKNLDFDTLFEQRDKPDNLNDSNDNSDTIFTVNQKYNLKSKGRQKTIGENPKKKANPRELEGLGKEKHLKTKEIKEIDLFLNTPYAHPESEILKGIDMSDMKERKDSRNEGNEKKDAIQLKKKTTSFTSIQSLHSCSSASSIYLAPKLIKNKSKENLALQDHRNMNSTKRDVCCSTEPIPLTQNPPCDTQFRISVNRKNQSPSPSPIPFFNKHIQPNQNQLKYPNHPTNLQTLLNFNMKESQNHSSPRKRFNPCLLNAKFPGKYSTFTSYVSEATPSSKTPKADILTCTKIKPFNHCLKNIREKSPHENQRFILILIFDSF